MNLIAIVCGVLFASLFGGGAWLYTPDKPRAQLEAEYATAPSEYVVVDGMRVHVRDTGPRAGPVVVMLHGFASSLHTWEPWAKDLSDKYRVIRFDLPGFGLTGPDPSGNYTDDRDLKVLGDLMDALSVGRAALIGNSMGGKLAWMFAAEHPDRVTKLVLISPDGFASPGFEYGRKPEIPAVAGLLRYTLPKAVVRSSLAPAYGNPAALTEATLDRYRDMMLAPGVRGAMIARMEQIDLRPPEPLLARIVAPTLIVWGMKDAMIPETNAADYLNDIRGSRLVTFPDLGHVPMEEAPERSIVPVRKFLDE